MQGVVQQLCRLTSCPKAHFYLPAHYLLPTSVVRISQCRQCYQSNHCRLQLRTLNIGDNWFEDPDADNIRKATITWLADLLITAFLLPLCVGYVIDGMEGCAIRERDLRGWQ